MQSIHAVPASRDGPLRFREGSVSSRSDAGDYCIKNGRLSGTFPEKRPSFISSFNRIVFPLSCLQPFRVVSNSELSANNDYSPPSAASPAGASAAGLSASAFGASPAGLSPAGASPPGLSAAGASPPAASVPVEVGGSPPAASVAGGSVAGLFSPPPAPPHAVNEATSNKLARAITTVLDLIRLTVSFFDRMTNLSSTLLVFT